MDKGRGRRHLSGSYFAVELLIEAVGTSSGHHNANWYNY